jgi:Bacterial Ig-like domain (group 3)/Glycosyl hydrolase family 26
MVGHVPRSWFRRTSLASIFLVATALTFVVGGVSATEGAVGINNLTSLGVYTGYQSPALSSAFGNAIGNQPMYAMDFLDGTSWSTMVNGAPSYMSAWSNSGYTMVWGVPMLPDTFSPDTNAADTSGSAYGLQQGAAGAYNANFLQLAQDMVAGGQASSIVRIGWEFNGGWFPWAAQGQAAAFVAYWQQIVNTMRSVPGQNFTFEWNPTAGDQGAGNVASYYPGNAYVDYIGLDLYDEAWATYPGIASQWNTYLTEPYGLNWLASFAGSMGKPITLPEWGLDPEPSSNNGGAVSQPGTEVGGGDDPAFIDDMAQWINQNNVFDATYWDYGWSRLSPTSNPQSDAAFINDFGGAPSSSAPLSGGPPATGGSSTTTTTGGSTTTSGPTTAGGSSGTGGSGSPGAAGGGGTGSGSAGGGSSAGGSSGGSEAGSSPPGSGTSPSSGETASSVTVAHPSSPVVTAKRARFRAQIRTTPSAGADPVGNVTWRVTSRNGAPVPCSSGHHIGARANGITQCTVPAGTLSAGAGPYMVLVQFEGGNGVAPSAGSLLQPVVRATSKVKVRSKALPGNEAEVVAAVTTQKIGSSLPTGTVRFVVRGGSCLGGNTVSVESGKATCVLVGSATTGKAYSVRARYSGDLNFGASVSSSTAVANPS